MQTITISGWMDRALAARAGDVTRLTDLDRAGTVLAGMPVSLAAALASIRRMLPAAGPRTAKPRRRTIDAADGRLLVDLGAFRGEVEMPSARLDDLRWTAYDPRLPKSANANNGRIRAA